MSIDQQMHSLEAQLRDCRELLNQTNQELAALGNERARLADENEALRARIERLTHCAKESQDWNWIAAQEHSQEIGITYYEIPEMQELRYIANFETPAQSLAHIKAQAVTDALEYATGQVGSDDSAESLVDAICEHLENLSDGKFPTVGSTGNTWRSIKAAGAREALERAMEVPGFSGTVVRVDVMREIIEQMEGE